MNCQILCYRTKGHGFLVYYCIVCSCGWETKWAWVPIIAVEDWSVHSISKHFLYGFKWGGVL